MRSGHGVSWLGLTSPALIALAVLTFTANAAAIQVPDETAAIPAVQFNRDIRPLLSDRCFRCHGPDSAAREASLRLDRPPLTPQTQSKFAQRISSEDPAEQMPPPESGLRLSESERATLNDWIAQGAPYEVHWSLVAPRRPPLPPVSRPDWPLKSLDYFVLAELDRRGLQPTPPADPSTWLRRVHLDLTGLPPSAAERTAYLLDQSPAAEERVVDRLLASPHFGERLALDWLDSARYADTNGYFSDLERPIWPWRDWLIEAFNSGLPIDAFTIHQLAGDLLPNATLKQKIATGFLRNHMVTNETGVIDEEYRVEYVADRLDTTAAVWLGLTVGCARCHDHKFDPISQREYYQLFAFFNQGPETGLAPGNPPPLLDVADATWQQQLERLQAASAALQSTIATRIEQIHSSHPQWEALLAQRVPSPPTNGLHCELLFSDSAGDAAGIRGKALKLGPTESRLADASPPIAADSPWTISFWVQVENASLACLLSTMVQGTDRHGFELLWQKGRLKLSLVHDRETSELRASTRNPLPVSGWHHVAVVWQGASHPSPLQVFTDGERQSLQFDRQSLSGSITAGPLWIGRSIDGLGFSGRLDQLRSYNRALTDAEIVDSLYRGEQLSGILDTAAAERTANQQQRLQQALLDHFAEPETVAAWQQLQDAKQAESKWLAAKPQTLVMADQPQARDTFILLRGQYDQRGERVLPDVPALLPALPPESRRNRLTLARWLVDPAHPLTSRVLVNRWWAMLFGIGLVRTPGDFGAQSEPPDYPQLLDWLAVDFREQGWNLKALLKEIVLSATYRQSAAAAEKLLLDDPENRLLARGPRFRLPGELIRDQTLAVSGLLTRQTGGPGIRPWQPPGLWESVSYDGELSWQQQHDERQYRRSLYIYWKRQAPPPALLIFDSPTRETCSLQRPRTNTPLQALVLLNDPAFIEAARCLASRILTDSKTDHERLAMAFSEVLARNAEPEELAVLERLLRQQLESFRDDPLRAQQLVHVGDAPIAGRVEPTELAAWTTVISSLMNLDEFINKP
jgi:mono/diheme cytochrome c family protein